MDTVRYFDLKVLMIIVFVMLLIFSISARAQNNTHRHSDMSLVVSVPVAATWDDYYDESDRFIVRKTDGTCFIYP